MHEFQLNIAPTAPVTSRSSVSEEPIGIIAGNGSLPILLANKFIQAGKQCYIAILSDEIDLTLYKNFSYQIFKIGMIGAIIKYFRKANVTNIVLAGGIKRMNLRSIKVDLTGSILLARILKQKFLGDDKLLSIIISFLQDKGFNVVPYYEIINANEVIITNHSPSAEDLLDIELGVKLLDNIGPLDVGQSVIVEDGYILGIEAAEGTDNLIKRCVELRKKPTGAVLVKLMKKGQDSRVDMPAVGPSTLYNLAKYQYQGLVIPAAKIIVIEPELMVQLANKHGLFIHRI